MPPVITLTTDFGDCGPFVGVMKAVLRRHAPDAEIADLTHRIARCTPCEAGFWLARSYRYFPAGGVHVEMGVFSTIFRRRSAHPLADARRGERLAGAVRASANPLEVATTAADWLEAAAADDTVTATEVARIGQLAQEASQGAMRTLAQQYVSVGVRTPAEQARAWSALNRFHVGTAACFDAALARVAAGTDVRMEFPRMAICALRSSAAQLKWLHVGREPVDETLWSRRYGVFALAERLGILGSRAKAFADDDRTSTPQQEFARLVALAIASPRAAASTTSSRVLLLRSSPGAGRCSRP